MLIVDRTTIIITEKKKQKCDTLSKHYSVMRLTVARRSVIFHGTLRFRWLCGEREIGSRARNIRLKNNKYWQKYITSVVQMHILVSMIRILKIGLRSDPKKYVLFSSIVKQMNEVRLFQGALRVIPVRRVFVLNTHRLRQVR